jgi:hypothetical protein
LNAPPEAVKAVQALFQEVVQGKPVPEILDKIVVP